MEMEKSDINVIETAATANQPLEKELINLEKKNNIGNNNNNHSHQTKRNSFSSSFVSLSKLNVNYSNSLTNYNSNNKKNNSINTLPHGTNVNNINSTKNSNYINKGKFFSFGKMNKSINNSNRITNLNDKNSPFQLIKAQLAYKHYEILYKPKNFKAGILPIETNNSDYTHLKLEYLKKRNPNQNSELNCVNLTKTKPNSSRLSASNINNNSSSIKKNKLNQKMNESKSMSYYLSNQNELISSSLNKMDYVKSMIVNNTNTSKLNGLNEDMNVEILLSKRNNKKLESLYQNIPSLLPYINRRYDNEFNALSNQPSFYLNYKQAGSLSFHNNDLEGSTSSFNKSFKINTAAPKNWLKLKYSGGKQDSSIDYISNTKTNFLVTNQS